MFLFLFHISSINTWEGLCYQKHLSLETRYMSQLEAWQVTLTPPQKSFLWGFEKPNQIFDFVPF